MNKKQTLLKLLTFKKLKILRHTKINKLKTKQFKKQALKTQTIKKTQQTQPNKSTKPNNSKNNNANQLKEQTQPIHGGTKTLKKHTPTKNKQVKPRN